MKKSMEILLLCLICLAFFFSCDYSLKNELSVGVIGITEDHQYYAPLINALVEYGNTDENLTVTLRYSDADAAKEAIYAEELSSSVDYLLIVPSATFNASNTPENVAATITAANETPIIFLDVNPFRDSIADMPENVYFFGYNNDQVSPSKLVMTYLAEELNSSGEVVILRGPSDVNNSSYWIAQGRVEGAMEVINDYAGITLYDTSDCNWSETEAKTIVETWIADDVFNTVDAIVCGNDSMALGALNALKEAGITDVLIIGFDGILLNEIKSGEILASISLYVERLASPAFNLIYKIDNGETLDQENKYSPELITTENVDVFLSY